MPLNINELNAGFSYVKIGILTNQVINSLNLSKDECNIVLWEDRFKYIQKHKSDFKSEESFYKCVAQIPEIIANPDYIGKHPTKNSIEYIKRIDELVIVAIRIKQGQLALRTVFPLTESQLQDYIQSKTVISLKTIDNC